VEEMARVLKPGGRAIVGVPNRHDPFLRPLFATALQAIGLYGYGYEKSYLTPARERDAGAGRPGSGGRDGDLVRAGMAPDARPRVFTPGAGPSPRSPAHSVRRSSFSIATCRRFGATATCWQPWSPRARPRGPRGYMRPDSSRTTRISRTRPSPPDGP
jgi:SAM-dependent methyltransferase